MTRKEQEQEARKQFIIDAAVKIFSKDGFEPASMNEIAKEAGYTKKTLYQYFEDKADIFLSVLIQEYLKLYTTIIETEYKQTSGFDILRQGLYKQYEYYKNNSGTFRMMYDIGNVRKLSDNPKIHEYLKIDKDMTESLKKIIELGQKDGSIAKTKNALKASQNLKFLTTAIFDKLVAMHDYYISYIGRDIDELAHSLLEQILDSLRPDSLI
jgi:AcrR family transcriptional regulator